MLEKLAEMVRDDMKEANDTYGLLPCAACDGRPAESEKCRALGRPCPEMQDHSGSLMLARWAVLLVAKGLEKMPEAKIEDLKERKRIEGMPTAEYMCAMSNLGINFLNLLSEAIISDRKAKEVKLDV